MLKIYVNFDKEINLFYLFISALCFALSILCRPSYMVLSVFLLPILYKILKRKEKKQILKSVLFVGIPYILVGIYLAYSNYIRFGNIFEFGFNYQITVNNNSNIQWKIIYAPHILLTYLFALPSFSNMFPFINLQYNYNLNSFYGYCYVEAVASGIVFLQPILSAILLIAPLKRDSKNRSIFNLVIYLLIVAGIVLILNSLTCGAHIRYFCDFSWMLVLASLLIFFNYISNQKNESIKKVLTKFLLIITIITFIYNFVIGVLIGESDLLRKYVADQYYKIRYSICFWE